MKKLIDLTQNINKNMDVHPYDEKIKLYQDKKLKNDGYNNYRLEIGMHAGTHIDTPMHMIDSDKYIKDYSLDKFIGSGVLLDVRGESVIKYKSKYDKIINVNDIVLLYTNHSKNFGSKEYYEDYPVVDEKLAEYFKDKGIKILGMDSPSPDKTPFEVHKILFDKNIFIIENLTNLDKLLDVNKFEVIALPLKIKADSSIARVIAKIVN